MSPMSKKKNIAKVNLSQNLSFFANTRVLSRPGPFQGPDFISPEFGYHLHKVRIHNAELSFYPSPLSFIACMLYWQFQTNRTAI